MPMAGKRMAELCHVKQRLLHLFWFFFSFFFFFPIHIGVFFFQKSNNQILPWLLGAFLSPAGQGCAVHAHGREPGGGAAPCEAGEALTASIQHQGIPHGPRRMTQSVGANHS